MLYHDDNAVDDVKRNEIALISYFLHNIHIKSILVSLFFFLLYFLTSPLFFFYSIFLFNFNFRTVSCDLINKKTHTHTQEAEVEHENYHTLRVVMYNKIVYDKHTYNIHFCCFFMILMVSEQCATRKTIPERVQQK